MRVLHSLIKENSSIKSEFNLFLSVIVLSSNNIALFCFMVIFENKKIKNGVIELEPTAFLAANQTALPIWASVPNNFFEKLIK